ADYKVGWLPKFLYFCCNRRNNQCGCVPVPGIVLHNHCRPNAMSHRTRLIAEIHIKNISSIDSGKKLSVHPGTSLPIVRSNDEAVPSFGATTITHFHTDLKGICTIDS